MTVLGSIAIALALWVGPPPAPGGSPAQPERAEPAAEPERPEPPAPSGPGPAAGAGQATPGPTASVDDSPIAVTTRLEPDPSNIGDALEYQIVVGYPRGYSVNLPSVVDVSPLHLVEVAESEPEATGDGLRKTFTLRLQHFDVTEAAVPSFPLTYVDPDGAVQTRTVPAHAFTVEALLANEADPQRRGEDPPISIEYPNTLAETIIWSTLGTLLALALLVPVIRRLWGRRTEAPLPPPIPPHEVAYEALRELEQGDLIAEQRYLEYYLQLTEIAKGYLEGRFGVPALDRTTEEIRRTLMLRGESIAPLSPDEVVAFLQSCDLVKFARFTPDVDEAQDALTTVRTMVDRTVPAAAAKTGTAGAKADGPANDEPGASGGSSEGEAAKGEAARAEAAKDEAARAEAAKDEAAKDEPEDRPMSTTSSSSEESRT